MLPMQPLRDGLADCVCSTRNNAFKALHDQALSCLQDLIVTCYPKRGLRSQTACSLVFPQGSCTRTAGARDFSYRAALLWNQLPVWGWEEDTISAPKDIRLKMMLSVKLALEDGSEALDSQSLSCVLILIDVLTMITSCDLHCMAFNVEHQRLSQRTVWETTARNSLCYL